MLIFVLVFTLLAGALLSLISSHTKMIESDIRRIKGYYAAEAATVHAMDQRRKGEPNYNPNIEWIFDSSGNPVVYKTAPFTIQAGGIYGTSVVNATFDYRFNW
jgi:ketosteroid isomerase-like protein